MAGFTSTATMMYYPSDAKVTAPYSLTDYITARLLSDNSGKWNKFDRTKVDEVNSVLSFDFSNTNDDGISGDYTAGIDDAIPDKVTFYETISTGGWDNGAIWNPVVAGGPRGSIVRINTGHIVTTATNFISNYTTDIEGVVKLNETFGHRFGTVTGMGTLYTESNTIPAGSYESFFSSAGGTLEYGGTSSYDVLAGIPVVNNLTFSGTGSRNLPLVNITLNGDLTLNGSTVNTSSGYFVTIAGSLYKTGGVFNAVAGSSVEFNSFAPQYINGDFTGTSSLSQLEVNNPNGLFLQGNVFVKDLVNLTKGNITPGSSTLTLGLSAAIFPASGTSSSYVNGALSKLLNPGGSFTFPVGDDGNLGTISILNVGNFSGTAPFTASYTAKSDPSRDPLSIDAALKFVSKSEYWTVTGGSGSSGQLSVLLDGSNDAANAAASLSDLCFVGWDGAKWVKVGGTTVASGTASSGMVTCSSGISFDTYKYITLGLQNIPPRSVTFTSSDVTICKGQSTDLRVYFVGSAPWTFSYTENGINKGPVTTSSNPYKITVSPSTTAVYKLTSLDGLGGVVVGAPITVTVNETAGMVTLISSDVDNLFCAGTRVTYSTSSSSPYSIYTFSVSSIVKQNGSLSQYSNNQLKTGDVVSVVAIDGNGCTATATAPAVTVNPVPTVSWDASTLDRVCASGLLGMKISYMGGQNYSYSWSVQDNAANISGTNGYDKALTWLDNATLFGTGGVSKVKRVSVIVTDSNSGCAITLTKDVTVWRLPVTGSPYHLKNDISK